MAEHIEREAALHAILGEPTESHYPSWYAERIKALPAADVVPVVHGRWEQTEAPFMNDCEDCSVCGYRTVWGHRFNYCPNCGAKMDGGADND